MTARRRLLRAAAGLAVITALARVAGFARTIAFGREVGAGCVGSVYQTANFIPNIVFDVVAGGMLSALVVPVLAPVIARGERGEASRLASALLNWTLLVLAPITLVVAVAAGPIVGGLLGAQPDCAGARGLGTRMLVVFAPQILFYGAAVVLGGVLAAHERFTSPALAPLLSSLVVISAYLVYGSLAGSGRDVAGLPAGAEYVLSVGTTVGVVVLAGCLVGPVWRSGTRWTPTLRFPAEVGHTVKVAALAGAGTLAAQQVATAVMIRLANADTAAGTLVIVTIAQALFLLPWAVLSLPVATTSFPRLSAEWDAGARVAFADRLARAGTVVLLAGAVGTALLVAVAEPAGIVLLGPSAPGLGDFTPTAIAFALGLTGWSMVALLGRALYASGHFLASAGAQIGGQLTVIGVDVVLGLALDRTHRAVALGIGNSVGVSVAALLLVVAGRRAGVFAALGWINRTVAAGLFAALLAGTGGWLVGRQARHASTAPALGWAVLATVVATGVFAAAILAADARGVRRQLGRPAA